MHPIRFNYAPLTTSAAGIADDVAYLAGGYALTAAGADDGLGHLITILGNAAVDHSGKTFTITGTNANDEAQTESIAGPNGIATVSSTKYFKTVTSVTVSATTGANTFDIGWLVGAVGRTYPLNHRAQDFQVSLALIITGTISVTVQHTLDALHEEYSSTLSWLPHSSLVTKTASADGNYAYPVTATRLLINSVTNGATVGFQIVQG